MAFSFFLLLFRIAASFVNCSQLAVNPSLSGDDVSAGQKLAAMAVNWAAKLSFTLGLFEAMGRSFRKLNELRERWARVRKQVHVRTQPMEQQEETVV